MRKRRKNLDVLMSEEKSFLFFFITSRDFPIQDLAAWYVSVSVSVSISITVSVSVSVSLSASISISVF